MALTTDADGRVLRVFRARSRTLRAAERKRAIARDRQQRVLILWERVRLLSTAAERRAMDALAADPHRYRGYLQSRLRWTRPPGWWWENQLEVSALNLQEEVPLRAAPPCQARPGSRAKLDVLQQRLLKGQELFALDDRQGS